MSRCRICQEREADKKNSHQLPSFLAAMICSSRTYKRGGAELMVQIDKYGNHIYASGLPDTKWEELFDDLSEERIQEITKNPVSEDDVFCSQCEKALGNYIESPYASLYKNNQKIGNEVPIVFWISVAWRLSTQGTNGFTLGADLENRLRLSLHKYITLRQEGKGIGKWDNDLNVCYQMVCCKDYCRKEGGFLYCDYDNADQRLTMFVGDICISISFRGEGILDGFSFYGMENYLRQAPINNGLTLEKRGMVNKAIYKQSVRNFVERIAPMRLQWIYKLADTAWSRLGCQNTMPWRMKHAFATKIVSEDVKMGERYTAKHFAKIFSEVIRDPSLYL